MISTFKSTLPGENSLIRLAKKLQKTSPSLPQPDGTQTSEIPVLPEHLDKLLDLPWNPDHSRHIDWWLWYIQQEFEMVGGTV